MNRRNFMRLMGPALVNGRQLTGDVTSDGWRTFELKTRVEVLRPSGPTRVWLPEVLIRNMPFQRSLAQEVSAEGGKTEVFKNSVDALGIVTAEFPAGIKPVMTLTSRVATKNYAVEFTIVGNAAHADRAELEHFLRPTRFLPTDGIVKATADKITKGARTDLQKARAIYNWIVDSTSRDPNTRGCGRGDIRHMLESKNLRGKCADLNSLYVGLARAVRLPARDVYGIRIAKSKLGYQSLGTSSANVTKAQHCRAEVYIAGYGWIPVDAADVRKVILEEPPGNRPLDDEMVKKARNRLFGSWEMNWVAYNFAHDVTLPRSTGAPIKFLMYPQAETRDGRLDSLDPATFKYEITSQEIAPGVSEHSLTMKHARSPAPF
jgi:transglutaminase-like putative cysteine protease